MLHKTRAVPKLSLQSYAYGSKKDQVQFIDDLFLGLKDYGFIILQDHLVEQKIVDHAYALSAELFNLSAGTKNSYICPEGGGQRGYTSFGKEHAKNYAAGDLKEFWHVGRELPPGHALSEFYPPNIWPKELPEFKATLSSLYESMDKTSVLLLEALGVALEVPPGYFTDMVHLGNSILRLIHYPPLAKGVPQNAVRSAAHEDINLITILVGATSSGLELLDRDGRWLPVDTDPGTLIVDSGDMLSRLCNEVIPSTTHRVVNPQDLNSARFSMPYFVHPHPQARIECLPSCKGEGAKYPPISSHDFLMQRLVEIGLK